MRNENFYDDCGFPSLNLANYYGLTLCIQHPSHNFYCVHVIVVYIQYRFRLLRIGFHVLLAG